MFLLEPTNTLHVTKAEAIQAARENGLEAFQVIDEWDGTQVYVEYPQAHKH